MPALAKAGSGGDPCGGPPKVIVQSKRRTNILVYQGKLGWKITMLHFLSFLKITNARIAHKRGARLRQIGPTGLRPALGAVQL
jgi:hypothetical protein